MFNPNSKTYHFVRDNMMLENNPDYQDFGMGDALWRTSVSYMAYKNDILKSGIMSCFRKFTLPNRKGYFYQAARYANRYHEDDVSRDQVIMALSALKVNNDIEELKDLAEHIPKRISRRYKGSIVMDFWKKSIRGKGKFNTFMFHLLELVEFSLSVFLNKFIRLIMGWNKEYSQDWYCGYDKNMGFWHYDSQNDKYIWITEGYEWVNNGHKLSTIHNKKKKTNKFYKFMDSIEYPEYALHLTAWMIYVSDDTFLKKILQKLAIWLAEKDNLLIRMLMGDNVSDEEIEKYYPINGYRWSSRFDGRCKRYIAIDDDAKYNTFDKDLLYALKKNQ